MRIHKEAVDLGSHCAVLASLASPVPLWQLNLRKAQRSLQFEDPWLFKLFSVLMLNYHEESHLTSLNKIPTTFCKLLRL